jgi:CelD/BcsL family acetyltransferase involved in cellulose biosynthesis
MRIDLVDPLALSTEELSAWESFQAGDRALASPFLSPRWPQALAQVDGPDRRCGRVAVARDGHGTPVAFLPLRLAKGAALPMGAPMADYQAVVTAPGLRLDPRELIRAAGEPRFDFNHLLAEQAAFAPFVRGTSESQIIDLSAGYEAYAAERRAGGHDILKDAAKKRRKLEREHGAASFTALSDDPAEFDQLIDWKRRQYRATRQTDILAAGWPLELLRQLHGARDARFRGALFSLRVGGRLIAVHFALLGGAVLHAWFIAHDPEFSRYSPGVILIDHILQWASAQGVRELDLGPGDYRFKLQLANATRRVAHGFVGRPSAASLMREAQYRVRNAAESLPLGRVSHWPGKAMRRVDLWMSLR